MNRHQRRANAKLQRKSNDPYTAAETLSNLGIALRAQGKLDEAIATFRRAIRVKPDVALFHFNLGAMLHECRRFDEAVVAYRQAIQIKPDYAEAYSNLGTALRDLDKLEEAITVQRQAIRLKPSVASAHCNLGAALYDQGRLEEAIASYRRAISLEPNFDVAHGNLGAALIELGRSLEGRSTLEHAVHLAPRNIKHRRYLGELKPYTAGDPRLAELERLARDAARLSVDDRIELHFTLGKAYDDIGWHAEAFRQWRDGNALKRQHIA